MKVRGNGQAKVLTSAELALLFGEGLTTPRARLLFGICLFTGCLILETLGLKGVSIHRFRRTALTQIHNAGVPLRHIQEISGHRSLATLQRYLEVSSEQKERAISVIGW